eukprot:386520-Rhodomonas_salina.1
MPSPVLGTRHAAVASPAYGTPLPVRSASSRRASCSPCSPPLLPAASASALRPKLAALLPYMAAQHPKTAALRASVADLGGHTGPHGSQNGSGAHIHGISTPTAG